MTRAKTSLLLLMLLVTSLVVQQAESCAPGAWLGRRRGPGKLTPLVYKQHVPNVAETALGASGPPEGPISRNDHRFTGLVTNTDPNIVFRDNTGSPDDRLTSQRLKDKLQTLAIAVMNHWSDQPGLRLRVTLTWHDKDDDLQRDDVTSSRDSLHLEGRAADITTSDRDRSKYGMLARLAVEAGFDWVYMESRGHVHVSVKSETSLAVTTGGCFPGSVQVSVEGRGAVAMSDVTLGDRVLALDPATGTLVYSDVILFMHRASDVTAVFTRALTSSGVDVTLTPSHLIYVINNDVTNVAFADTLKTTDSLLTVSTADDAIIARSDVINVTSVTDRGLYAPVTQHGTIVVGGVVTSCYALIDSHATAHAVFAPIRWYWALKSMLSTGQSTARVEKVGQYTHRDLDLWPRQSDLDIHWFAQALYSVGYWLVPSHRRL